MNKKDNTSEPNVPMRAGSIHYYWNGTKLGGFLGIGALPPVFEQFAGDGPAVNTVVMFESGITSDTAIAALQRIIEQIKLEGLPCPDMHVTQKVADQIKADEEAFYE